MHRLLLPLLGAALGLGCSGWMLPGPWDGDGTYHITLTSQDGDAEADGAIIAERLRAQHVRFDQQPAAAHTLDYTLRGVRPPAALIEGLVTPGRLACSWVLPEGAPRPTDAQVLRHCPSPDSCVDLALARPPLLENADVAYALVDDSPDVGATVRIELTPAAAVRFETATGRHVHEKLAIVLDGRVLSAPLVMEAITGGWVVITLGGVDLEERQAEADALVASLSVGEVLGGTWVLAGLD